MVIPLRFERRTYCLEGSCSIQLSYGTFFFKRSWSSKTFFERSRGEAPFNLFVGTPRFELGISCSQSRRDNRTTLYPVRYVSFGKKKDASADVFLFLAEKGGFEPPVP